MKNLQISLFAFIALLFATVSGTAQQTKTVALKKFPVEVIQFHSGHRCVTCVKIEKLRGLHWPMGFQISHLRW